MKRLFSILFASLILFSGLHLTVASHICCGELAAVKYSFTGEKATCGMEDNTGSCPANGEIDTNCCKNRVASCTSDSNYFPSTQIVKDLPAVSTHLFTGPAKTCIPSAFVSRPLQSMVGPPVFYSFNSVDQSFICVFII
jgi:hypothetical protein